MIQQKCMYTDYKTQLEIKKAIKLNFILVISTPIP